MSGHSKWHSIRHKKAAVDAKRGKVFSRLIKEVTVAARLGGGDPSGNPRLRAAIAAAKAANMPASNIERAVKKGTGELPGVSYEEFVLEGYGPGGVAVLVELMTDNRNRTVAEIRHLFSKHGNNLGEVGCVAWMFEKKGLMLLKQEGVDEDALMEAALDVGAEDVKAEEGELEITTDAASFEEAKKALEGQGYEFTMAELTMLPQSNVRLEGRSAEQMLKLMEMLEDHDDVQNVYANFDIPDEVMERITA
jgi:YebC/PmpR family DNA-binding regulatory protein